MQKEKCPVCGEEKDFNPFWGYSQSTYAYKMRVTDEMRKKDKKIAKDAKFLFFCSYTHMRQYEKKLREGWSEEQIIADAMKSLCAYAREGNPEYVSEEAIKKAERKKVLDAKRRKVV